MSDQVDTVNTQEFLNEVKCPICMEIPTQEIYQCKNGHHICNKCDGKITQCPICRSSFRVSGRIRCLLTEKLMDKMKFECPYKDEGCNEKVLRKDLNEHGRYCKFRHSTVSICRYIGYPKCQRAIIPGDVQQTIKHLQDAHGAFICPNFGETILLENFNRAVDEGKRQHWTPVIFTGGNEEEPKNVFVVLAVFEPNNDPTRGNISLICATVGDGCGPEFVKEGEGVEEDKKYRVNFFLKSMHVPPEGEADVDDVQYCVTDLDWSVPCVKIYYVGELLKNMVLKTPASVLLQSFMKEDCGHLQIKISIVNGVEGMMEGTGTGQRRAEQRSEQRAVSVQAVSAPVEVAEQPEPMIVEISTTPLLDRYRESLMGVSCDVCMEPPLANARYKCLQCADFDLCHDCFRSNRYGGHSGRRHIFALVQSLEQGDLLNLRSGNSRPIFGSTARRRWGYGASPFLMHNHHCSVCNGEEVSYICMDCSNNDTPCMFCKRCVEDERAHSQHILLKVDSSQQLGFVMTQYVSRGFSWSTNASAAAGAQQADN